MSAKSTGGSAETAGMDDLEQTGERLIGLAGEIVTHDWSTRLADLVGHASMRWKLTERQRHVLELIARGKANKEVAMTLRISERTVEIHVHNIAVRAGLQSRSELLAALLREALEGRHDRLRPVR